MKYLVIPFAIASVGIALNQSVKATPRTFQSTTETCDVMKVSDGDTIKVNCGGNVERVRFCGIDAPEIKHGSKPAQPYGYEASELVKRLINNGRVQIVEVDRDRYGRLVGEIWLGNTFINAEVVRQGYAYEYKQYSKSCPHRDQIRQAEDRAKANKVGVWDGGSYEAPWDFRKANRS